MDAYFNYGWHDSWIIGIDGENEGEKVNWHESYNLLIRGKKTFLQSRFSQGDKFFRLFLGDQCLGRQCYTHCKYKYDHSSADIRICDLWGKTYQDNEDGVSGAVAFTQKGAEILKEIDCHLIEHPFSVVAEGQMKTCPKMLPLRDSILKSLADGNKTIDDAVNVLDAYHRHQRNIGRLKHPIRTVCHLVKRIFK